MVRRFATAAVVVALCLACVGTALANDLCPPSWRGLPGTTFAKWEFSLPNRTPLADVEYNPNGSAQMTVTPGTCMEWADIYEGHQGVWPLSGLIRVNIWNYPPANPYKDIWIQITWTPDAEGGRPFVMTETPQAMGTLLSEQQIGQAGDDFWYHSVYQIHLEPNPPSEVIVIQGSVWVDEVVIDTICAPEPGSMVALTTGLIGIVGFARRRRIH